MVSKLLKLCSSLVLLVTVIHGNFDALEKKLKRMAKKGEEIDFLFMPKNNGIILQSTFGLVYKGERVADNLQVALKFVQIQHKSKAEHEFQMYSYLNATNNIEVERYGISAVHYYQEWEGFMLIVFSLFDGGDLHDLPLKRYFELGDERLAINSLILFRDFILQSKYIHSRGVRHDDIAPANIAVRLSRSFLIDFDSASKMMEDYCLGTPVFFARAAHFNELRGPKADWESFLYTMAFVNGINLGWKFPAERFHVGIHPLSIMSKNNIPAIMARLQQARFGSEPLKTVFLKIAEAVMFDRDRPVVEFLPPYDVLYETIVDGIREVAGSLQNATFTWLNNVQREAAIRDNERRIHIGDIPDPPNNFDHFEYPSYSLNSFERGIPKPTPKRRSFPFCGSTSTN